MLGFRFQRPTHEVPRFSSRGLGSQDSGSCLALQGNWLWKLRDSGNCPIQELILGTGARAAPIGKLAQANWGFRKFRVPYSGPYYKGTLLFGDLCCGSPMFRKPWIWNKP